MIRVSLIVCTLLLTFLVGCSVVSDDTANDTQVQVIRVVDGDTLLVDMGGREERVRLILVDTPETVHPEKPVQPFGPESFQFAKDTLEGKEIELEFDVSERDKYGRILAYVWVDDNMFNELLLEEGLARVAVFPPDVKYLERFREIEAEARQKKMGIWSLEDYVSEEGYNEDVME